MVKAWMRDDVPVRAWDTRPSQFDPVKAGLDDDGCIPCTDLKSGMLPVVPGEGDDPIVNPVLKVRIRTKQGYEDDGSPRLEWVDLVEGQAISYTQRQEFDQAAGRTVVDARATMLYEGDVRVTETASVTDDSGYTWRVLSVAQLPGMLSLVLQRIEQGDLGEVGS